MKSIMWVQSDNPGGYDYLFIDGVLAPEQDETRRAKAMDLLLKAQGAKYQCDKEVRKLRSESGSPNFTLAEFITMGFLYKSVFNEKASDGRFQSFVLWCSNSETSRAWEIAKANGYKLNYSLREIELPLIQAFLKKKRNLRIASVSALLLILVFAYVIIH